MFNPKEIDKRIDELLSKEPSPENLNTVGDLFLKKGDKERALTYFLRAAKNTAVPKKAAAIYKKILKISPLDTEIYEALIEILERSYNIPEAIHYLDLLCHLYQNKGETLKFNETQRRLRELRQEWGRVLPSKDEKKSEEPKLSEKPLSYVKDYNIQDSERSEVLISDIREGNLFTKRFVWIISVFFLIMIAFLAILVTGKKKIHEEYHFQKQAGNYDITISSVTKKTVKDLPQNLLSHEDLENSFFNLIIIKARDGCIPSEIINNPFDSISCMNNNGDSVAPLSHPVTNKSMRVVYKYGICPDDNSAIVSEFYLACPLSHSSGLKIKGLINEPIEVFWRGK